MAIVAWQRGHREGHKAGRDEGLVERWKLQAKRLAFEKHPPPPMYEQNQQLEATVSKLLEKIEWYENQIGIYELMWVKMKLEPEDRAWVERDLDQIEKAVKAASGRGD